MTGFQLVLGLALVVVAIGLGLLIWGKDRGTGTFKGLGIRTQRKLVISDARVGRGINCLPRDIRACEITLLDFLRYPFSGHRAVWLAVAFSQSACLWPKS